MSLWPFAASPRGRSTDAAPRHDAAPVWSAGPVAAATETLEDRLLLFVTLGGKWGDPQFGTSADVTYSFITEDIADQDGETLQPITEINDEEFGLDQIREVFQDAFQAWSDVAGVTFTELTDPGLDSLDAAADAVDIRIGARNIDDVNGILAFAFPPPDVEGDFITPINGDLTFDTSENWSLTDDDDFQTIDLISVAIHEIGHAIGLAHTDVGGSIMQPFYNEDQSFLGQDDIDGALFIYGPPLGGEFGLGLFVADGGGSIPNGTEGGTFRFEGNDVVTIVLGTDGAFRYQTYFDGSDVGLGDDVQITGVTLTAGGDLLMTFEDRVTVGGFTFETEDVARFRSTGDGAGFGADTDGAFDVYFDGSDVGLSGTIIDGLSVIDDGSFFFTAQTSGTVVGVGTFDANDIILFTQDGLGDDTDGSFSFALDGSDVGLTGLGEGIDGFDVNGPQLSLTTQGGFVVPGVVGNAADIVNFTFATVGEDTGGTFDPDLVIDSEFFGLETLNLTGFHLGPIQIADGTDTGGNGGGGGDFDPGTGGGVFPRPPSPRTPDRPDFPWGPGGGVNPDFPIFPRNPGFPGGDDPGDGGGDDPGDGGGGDDPGDGGGGDDPGDGGGGDDPGDGGGGDDPGDGGGDGGGVTSGNGSGGGVFDPFGDDWDFDFQPRFPGGGFPGTPDVPDVGGGNNPGNDDDDENGGDGDGGLDGDFDGDGDVDDDDRLFEERRNQDVLNDLFGGGFGGGF